MAGFIAQPERADSERVESEFPESWRRAYRQRLSGQERSAFPVGHQDSAGERRRIEAGPRKLSYSSDRLKGGGMMISRRSNTLETTEKRPGPSPRMAINIVKPKTTVTLESNSVGAHDGSKESPI